MSDENKLSRTEIAHLFSNLFKIIVLEESKYIESFTPAEYTDTLKEKEEIIRKITNTLPTMSAVNHSIRKLTAIARVMIKNVTSSYGLFDYVKIVELDRNQYSLYFGSYTTVYNTGAMGITMGSLYLLNRLSPKRDILYNVLLVIYTDDVLRIDRAFDFDIDKLKELYNGIQ